MTFGVIGREQPLLAELLMFAFQSAGHECIVFGDTDRATRLLPSIHVDSIVLDVGVHAGNNLDWLETIAATWPEIPRRALLIAHEEVKPEDAARIAKLGAEVIPRPLSIAEVERLVIARVRKVQLARASELNPGPEQASRSGLVR